VELGGIMQNKSRCVCGYCEAEYTYNEKKQLKHPVSDCVRSGRTWLHYNLDEPMRIRTEKGTVIGVCDLRFDQVEDEHNWWGA
jgi:transposase-like protein